MSRLTELPDRIARLARDGSTMMYIETLEALSSEVPEFTVNKSVLDSIALEEPPPPLPDAPARNIDIWPITPFRQSYINELPDVCAYKGVPLRIELGWTNAINCIFPTLTYQSYTLKVKGNPTIGTGVAGLMAVMWREEYSWVKDGETHEGGFFASYNMTKSKYYTHKTAVAIYLGTGRERVRLAEQAGAKLEEGYQSYLSKLEKQKKTGTTEESKAACFAKYKTGRFATILKAYNALTAKEKALVKL